MSEIDFFKFPVTESSSLSSDIRFHTFDSFISSMTSSLALTLQTFFIISMIATVLSFHFKYSTKNAIIRSIQNYNNHRLFSKARPSLDDVERISKGQAARKRGVGSRAVPHRLNEEERIEWNNAKTRQYLMLRGSGWRRERGDSPLANIYRQLCDAKNIPCISIAKGLGIGDDVSNATTSQDNQGAIENIVIVDFSPLRLGYCEEVTQIAQQCLTAASVFPSLIRVDDQSDPRQLGWTEEEMDYESDPIWRLPVHRVLASFSNRAESKAFAEVLVTELMTKKPKNKKDVEE